MPSSVKTREVFGLRDTDLITCAHITPGSKGRFELTAEESFSLPLWLEKERLRHSVKPLLRSSLLRSSIRRFP